MGVRSRWAAALITGLTITSGVTAAELEGRSGAIAWRATDVQQNMTSVDGKRHARHEFVLTLKNVGTSALRLMGYEAAVSYFGIPLTESTGSFQVTLPPGGEYRFLPSALLACLDESRACRFSEGPSWRIIIAGRAGGDGAFTEPIELTLPTEASAPVVRRERVVVTRVTSGPDPATRVLAAFKASAILVPASVNGHDLTLLFDTGAQVSILRPDVARRVGIAVPPDAPAFPIIGFGAPISGAIVRLPPVRIGDYLVEHLTGAVTSFPDFPFVIDGVLGTNFMEAFRITIDHRAKELRLEPAR